MLHSYLTLVFRLLYPHFPHTVHPNKDIRDCRKCRRRPKQNLQVGAGTQVTALEASRGTAVCTERFLTYSTHE